MWQDWALAIGTFGFAIALLPSVFSDKKPARATCLMTSIIMIAFIITYASLNLWMAFTSTSVIAVLWLILLFQERPSK